MPVHLKVRGLFVIERNSCVEKQTSKLFHSKLYLEINVLTELLRREITMSTYSMSQKRAGLNSQANKKIIQ